MISIRRIYDVVLPQDKEAITQVQEILHAQFSGVSTQEIQNLPKKLHNPLKYRFRSIVLVAEGAKRQVKGFALAYLCNVP